MNLRSGSCRIFIRWYPWIICLVIYVSCFISSIFFQKYSVQFFLIELSHNYQIIKMILDIKLKLIFFIFFFLINIILRLKFFGKFGILNYLVCNF
jgi:hypothetical protein